MSNLFNLLAGLLVTLLCNCVPSLKGDKRKENSTTPFLHRRQQVLGKLIWTRNQKTEVWFERVILFFYVFK